MLDFKPVTLEHKDLIEKYYTQKNRFICDYSPVDIIIWAHNYRTKICEEDGFLFTVAGDGNIEYFMPPISIGDKGDFKGAVEKLIAHAEAKGDKCVIINLDEELREFLKQGTVITIPFFAFPLGAALNFGQLISAGIPGIILGLLSTLLTGLGGYFVMKLMKNPHPAVGAAIGTTAGNAVGTPNAIAEADPTIAAIAPIATVQVAAAIIVTAICCPLLVSYLDKLEKRKASKA